MKYLDFHSVDYNHLWIVTRSVRNTPELVSSFNSLRAAQQAFAKQSNWDESHPLREAQIWIATTEVKYSDQTGYNVHEHMIWGTKKSRMDFHKFHDCWDRAAGFQGAHINVRRVHDARHAVNYVAKYLSKGIWGGLSSGRAYQVRAGLKGRNRIQSKRGTVPPKAGSRFCLCCFPWSQSECDG